MYAVDDLSDAIDVTREFLLPFRLGLWLKLALVIFFVGGATVGAPAVPPVDGGVTVDEPTADPAFDEALEEAGIEMEEFILGVILLAGFLFALWLVYATIGAIMEFVFLESLRSSSVHLRRYTNGNVGKGLRLLVFRLGLGLLFVAPIILLVGLGVLLEPSDAALLSLVLLGGLLTIGLAFAWAILNRFTTVFVAPIMLLEERGVLSAWRRFWPTLTGNWKEFAVYLVLIWVVQLVVGIAFVFLAGIIAIVTAIPFAILIAVFIFFGDVGFVLAVVTGLVAALVIFVAVMFLRVPIESYFRYYALLILGDTNSALDLVPDQRAAVRSDVGTTGHARSEPDDSWGGGVGNGDDERRWDDDDSADDDADGGWNDDDGRDDSDGWDDSSSWDEPDDEDGDDEDDGRGW